MPSGEVRLRHSRHRPEGARPREVFRRGAARHRLPPVESADPPRASTEDPELVAAFDLLREIAEVTALCGVVIAELRLAVRHVFPLIRQADDRVGSRGELIGRCARKPAGENGQYGVAIDHRPRFVAESER